MKKKNIPFLILIFTVFISYSQSNFYVSNSGNDANSGTEDQPFLTINQAISSFDALGGSCFIKGGTYHEEVNINNKNNINIKAHSNEHVIIDGTVEIIGSWVQSSGNSNIYETTLTQDIWQLFIDEQQQVPARWPNAQFNDDSVFDQANYWGVSDDLDQEGTITDKENLASSGINAEGALAIANFGSWRTRSPDPVSRLNIGR